MSSRDGTIIPYHTRRDDAIQQAHQLLEERDIEDKAAVSRKVAFAALKFSMLLQDTYKKIRLDMHKSLSFEGET
jgi:arginyl-tRNA synthetase